MTKQFPGRTGELSNKQSEIWIEYRLESLKATASRIFRESPIKYRLHPSLQSGTFVCLPLFSFMCGQSFPVSKDLMSATGTERGIGDHIQYFWCIYTRQNIRRWSSSYRQHGKHIPLTLLLKGFNRRHLCFFVHVPIVKHLVVGWEAAVPQFVWKDKGCLLFFLVFFCCTTLNHLKWH